MLTLDLHCDSPWVSTKYGKFDLDVDTPWSHVSTSKLKEGRLNAVTFALYLPDYLQDKLGPISTSAIQKQMDWIKEQGGYRAVANTGQAVHTFAAGKTPVFLALEGGRLLGTDPLKWTGYYAALGVKYLTLTHNKSTFWADSATDKLQHGGLTKLGEKVVKELQRLNVLIDVSHAADATFWNVMQVRGSDKPIIASHSGCRALVDHPRNLTDKMICAIAGTGGIVGVPFAKRFVNNVADHIDHIANLVGPQHVAIGSDLDGADMVPDVKSAASWGVVVMDALQKRGYTDETIMMIAGGNALRLFR
jgi:microsomal dipeptidase-like Zn-dependent dipeptidase